MRAARCRRGLFGGLQQASVLGLEDQIEGLKDIKDEEGGEKNRLDGKKRGGYCQQFSDGGQTSCLFLLKCFVLNETEMSPRKLTTNDTILTKLDT